MDKIRQAMLARLSDEDQEMLRAIYAPVVVGVPPQDASKHLCVTPEGEIRVYGVQKEHADPEEEGKRVYLASTDCGLSWKKHIVPENALGEAAYSPQSGVYMQCFPMEGRKTYPADYPDPEDGCYVLINHAGYDAPAEKIVRLYDKTLHFMKLPYYIASRNRWLIAAEYRYPDKEKFIVVAISDDDGETWRAQELPHAPLFVPAPPHKGTRWQDYSCEPTVVELSDGTLLMHQRTSLDFHYMCLSHDGGETWSDPQPSIFHGTLTMPVLHKLSDGRILHFWCSNQPLPEMDHETQWPALGSDEKTGVWEDVFTNRDVNHLAISEDDGKSWKGFRELYLNALRNRTDFRSVGGTDSRDKSVHQAEMLELPFGKVLISFGQNVAARRMMIFDPQWLYETARTEDFRYGLDQVTTHMYVRSNSGGYRGFSGHCSWNRLPGALFCQDPDGNFEEALLIARVHDERLLFEKQGVVWNFPAAKRGHVDIRLRVRGAGVRVCLTDHWYNACDETVGDFAPVRFEIADVEKEKWIDARIDYDESAARLSLNGAPAAEAPLRCPAPYGLCYVHIQTLAEEEDFAGTLIKKLSMAAD